MIYYIIVFKNTYDAMAAEKDLEQSSYRFTIMPTPTSIAKSCGICIRIDDKVELDKIIKNGVFEYKNIYLKNKHEYILI
ncbi:DUF3343 domain-containing protein [Clostridium uliginosum]|uniref:DUF3343 domain-containing protein n=1 Tax=Clostridium uliginosum TaxID=119641 RepID=UPI000B7F2CFC|nr:DUF3343 domain-containing protein [Clostridium uliginosum]